MGACLLRCLQDGLNGRDGTRTHTPFRAGDFKSPASAIPPLGRQSFYTSSARDRSPRVQNSPWQPGSAGTCQDIIAKYATAAPLVRRMRYYSHGPVISKGKKLVADRPIHGITGRLAPDSRPLPCDNTHQSSPSPLAARSVAQAAVHRPVTATRPYRDIATDAQFLYGSVLMNTPKATIGLSGGGRPTPVAVRGYRTRP